MADRLLNPQQEKFVALYTDPKSDTFANALQSALEAGYKQEYAENITHLMPDWLSESIGDMKLLQKAERVLNKTLDYETSDAEGKIDSALLRTQTDVAKFISERLNKSKYSARTEQTGPDGKDLNPITPEAESRAKAFDEWYKNNLKD